MVIFYSGDRNILLSTRFSHYVPLAMHFLHGLFLRAVSLSQTT